MPRQDSLRLGRKGSLRYSTRGTEKRAAVRLQRWWRALPSNRRDPFTQGTHTALGAAERFYILSPRGFRYLFSASSLAAYIVATGDFTNVMTREDLDDTVLARLEARTGVQVLTTRAEILEQRRIREERDSLFEYMEDTTLEQIQHMLRYMYTFPGWVMRGEVEAPAVAIADRDDRVWLSGRHEPIQSIQDLITTYGHTFILSLYGVYLSAHDHGVPEKFGEIMRASQTLLEGPMHAPNATRVAPACYTFLERVFAGAEATFLRMRDRWPTQESFEARAEQTAVFTHFLNTCPLGVRFQFFESGRTEFPPTHRRGGA